MLLRGAFGPIDGRYRLEVQDTGIGMPAGQLATLFGRFNKGAESDADSYGLGLSIVKTIADLHGIQLEVNSIVGLGTSFTLVFPG